MKKKQKIFFLILGLLFFIVPFFIGKYSIYKLFSLLLGLIFLEIALIINKKDKVWRIVFYPIIFLILAFAIDFGVTHIFNRIPIFSSEVKSSNKVKTYNSMFYRVYSCNNKLVIDDLYRKEYQCNENDLKPIDASSFLDNVIENYNKFKDKFVKIEGKVSKVNGTYNLALQSYTLTDDSKNGYVLFGKNVTLEVNFNEIKDLTQYKVYDSITVIGRITDLNKMGEIYTIKMYDSIVLESDLYDTFDLTVVEKNKCENDKTLYADTGELLYYTSCIDNIFVRYDEENVYDLSYVLIDKKMILDSLIKNADESKVENDRLLYKFDKFNILDCKNEKEIIIGNKDLKIDSPYCEVETNNNEL